MTIYRVLFIFIHIKHSVKEKINPLLNTSHTCMEIEAEMISMGILLLLLIQEGLVSVISKIICTKYRFIA